MFHPYMKYLDRPRVQMRHKPYTTILGSSWTTEKSRAGGINTQKMDMGDMPYTTVDALKSHNMLVEDEHER